MQHKRQRILRRASSSYYLLSSAATDVMTTVTSSVIDRMWLHRARSHPQLRCDSGVTPLGTLRGARSHPGPVLAVQSLAQMSFDPEVRAAAIYALGRLIDTGLIHTNREDAAAENAIRLDLEMHVLTFLMPPTLDGSPLVRAEVAAAISRAACVPASGGLKRHNMFFSTAMDAQQRRTLARMNDAARVTSGYAMSEPPSPEHPRAGGAGSHAYDVMHRRDARSDGHLAFGNVDDLSKRFSNARMSNGMSVGMHYVVSDRTSMPGSRVSLPLGFRALPIPRCPPLCLSLCCPTPLPLCCPARCPARTSASRLSFSRVSSS